jgi:type VI secretion system secreted protein VgrG
MRPPERAARLTAPGGPWHIGGPDPRALDYACFRYGVVGRAMGLPTGVLLRQAGRAHQEEHGADAARGEPGNGLFGGRAPYGNDPHRHALIEKGATHYDERMRDG